MMKQIYELKRSDIKDNPLWIFPMDESCEDELTVKPMDCNVDYHFEKQVIVQTTFFTSKGTEYMGYLYWGKPLDVSYIQPVIYVNNTDYITCWNGIVKPAWHEYPKNVRKIKEEFPIKFRSHNSKLFCEISGQLEGLYYLSNNEISFI